MEALSLDRVQTPRLLLVRMSEADLPDLGRMHRDARVMATLGGLRSEPELAELHHGLLDHWDRHNFGLWTVRHPSDGRFAGRGGLRLVTIDEREEVEVAYALMPEFWGKGLATELALASVRAGFEALGRPSLVCYTLPSNSASRRVMAKVGFRYERDFIWKGLLHAFHRLTAEQWRLRSSG